MIVCCWLRNMEGDGTMVSEKFGGPRLGHSNPFTKHHWEFVADNTQSPSSPVISDVVHPPTFSTASTLSVPTSGRPSSRGEAQTPGNNARRSGSATGKWRTTDRPSSGNSRPRTSGGTSKPSKLSEDTSVFTNDSMLMPFSENHEEHVVG